MTGIQLRGPSPAALSGFEIVLAAIDHRKTRKQLRTLLDALSLEDKNRPSDLRVSIDVDPYDLL